MLASCLLLHCRTVVDGDAHSNPDEHKNESHRDPREKPQMVQVRHHEREHRHHCSANGDPLGQLDVAIGAVLVVHGLQQGSPVQGACRGRDTPLIPKYYSWTRSPKL